MLRLKTLHIFKLSISKFEYTQSVAAENCLLSRQFWQPAETRPDSVTHHAACRIGTAVTLTLTALK